LLLNGDQTVLVTALQDGRLTGIGDNANIRVSTTNQPGRTEVTAIPEPATLGLFATFGGVALFIRRKFMI